MNELLGWYGLPKMDKSDTSSVSLETYPSTLTDHTSHLTDHISPIPDHTSRDHISHLTDHTPRSDHISHSFRRSQQDIPGSEASTKSNLTVDGNPGLVAEKRQSGISAVGAKLPNDTNNNSSSCGADDEDEMDDFDNDGLGDDLCDDIDDLRDSASVGSDVSGLVSPALVGGGVSEHERGAPIVCSWCQKNGNKLFTLGTSTGLKSFCSEVCFTQCRRASFKKNKVCDWCKHVRHTVNFVDFQDGDVQLQFCSEKCLNQYKMNVFCTETRQHLQAIQNLAGDEEKSGDGRNEPKQGEILITPELWMSGNSNSEANIKEEVDIERSEKVLERSQDGVKMDTSYDEEGEPGELRDREKFGRHLVMDGRSEMTDDSSCSNEGKIASTPISMYRQKSESRNSILNHLSTKSEITNHSDQRQRRERDRMRKASDNKSRLISTDHGRDFNKLINSSKDRVEKHQTSQRFISLSPGNGTTTTSDPSSSQSFLPNWATSQLMAMMPPNVSPSLGGSNLGPLTYGASPLLYSSLFGPAHMMTGVGSSKEAQAKARHESRRELLRDRDRFAELSTGERKRESNDRPGVQKSPSTSHSSGDATCSTNSQGLGILHSQGLNHLNLMTEFSKHLSQQFPMGNLNSDMNLAQYLTNPTLAGMFQLPFAYTPGQGNSLPFIQPPAAHIPTSRTHSPTSSSRQQSTTQPLPFPPAQGVPPITILVPYPVAVPIPMPVPIPIPIPIAPEKLFAYYREKEEASKPATFNKETQQVSTDPKPEPRSRPTSESRPRAASACHLINPSPGLSPRPSSKCSSVGCISQGPSSQLDSPEPGLVLANGRDSADSIMTLRREIGRSQLKAASTSPCTSSSYKHIMTPILPYSIDLSTKTSRVSLPHHNEDEAIDLSKMSSRSESPRRSVDLSEKENKSLVKRASLSDSDIDGIVHSQNLKVPRIHIISEPPDPPLSQPPVSIPLPPPQEQSTYSSRRSRILDAPSVPKKTRSPSPERRYIRTVPRDMVEAARRRGLRARVRTK